MCAVIEKPLVSVENSIVFISFIIAVSSIFKVFNFWARDKEKKKNEKWNHGIARLLKLYRN
jgi:hypothetical protein